MESEHEGSVTPGNTEMCYPLKDLHQPSPSFPHYNQLCNFLEFIYTTIKSHFFFQ